MNDDSISRSALRKELRKKNLPISGADVYFVRKLIDNAPTIEPKVVVIEPDIIEKLANSVVDVISKIDWDKAIEAYKARPQGEWIEVKDEVHYDYWTVCECSLCKHSWALGELSIEDIKDDYKFCPNCGADMRVKTELNNELKEDE